MAKRNSGWYVFADGTQAWFSGLSARERKAEEAVHGKVVRFIPD